MKPVRYSKDAIRTLRRMPRPTAERIRDKVAAYAADPASQAANVTALKGEAGVLRLRVGDWRVIFDRIRLLWSSGGEMRILLRPDTPVSVELVTGNHIAHGPSSVP